MSADLKQFERIKAKVSKLRSNLDRRQGALEGDLAHIKEECGCKTIRELKTLQKKKREEMESAESKFKERFEKFKEKWEEELEDV